MSRFLLKLQSINQRTRTDDTGVFSATQINSLRFERFVGSLATTIHGEGDIYLKDDGSEAVDRKRTSDAEEQNGGVVPDEYEMKTV